MRSPDPSVAAVLDEVDRLAAAAARINISGSERLGRCAILRDAQADLAALAGADPYTHSGSLILDLVAEDRARRSGGGTADPGVVERLSRHRTVTQLHKAAHQITTDTPGLLAGHPPGTEFRPGLPGTPLLDLADPFPPGTPSAYYMELPQGWNGLPSATINPAEKTDSGGGTVPAATKQALVVTSTYYENISRQTLDWGESALRRFQEMIETAVNVALEEYLITHLVSLADTPLSTLDEAEAAAGSVWGTAADTLVVNPSDWPAVRRAYSPQSVPFANVAVTGGIAAGVALVFPLSALWLLTDRVQWAVTAEPAILGAQIGASRYGLSDIRRTGAIAAAATPIVTP